MSTSDSPGAQPDWARRFDRQRRFAPLGKAGQERLATARVLIAGCGALGGSAAMTLARAGVGTLILVDRDVVDESNLPRQVLFDEQHAREGRPKALAAAETLARFGGPTQVEPHTRHIDAGNLGELARDCALVLDGCDNLETRYLINDWSVAQGRPWIYAGVVGSSGLVLPVLPGRGACLRCLFPEPAPAGTLDTCESAGVILPAVAAVSAWQCALALRLLTREAEQEFEPWLLHFDVWSGELGRLRASRRPDCPCCGAREFPFLRGEQARAPVVLCGRNTVQIQAARQAPEMDELERRLRAGAGGVTRLGSMLRFEAEGVRFSVFRDGRALLEGTDDPLRARALYDRYLGA